MALGAIAGRALLGRPVRVTAERGQVIDGPDGVGPFVLTAQPLRLAAVAQHGGYEEAFELLVTDLRLAATQV